MRPHPRWTWLVLLALAFAAAVVVWRLAETLSDDLRVVLTALPLLGWCLTLLFRMDGQGRTAPAPPGPGPGAAAGEAGEWRSALRRHRLHGLSGRYRVPLFLVIGPGGMGKSALLEQSTLPLDLPVEKADGRWWIGPEAIFVEATTGVADMAALAAALVQFRPACPVNGIVLAISPADLALSDTIERREIGEAIAAGIATLARATRSRPPLTVLLAKTDLAPGFAESMSGLTASERDQMWGFATPLEPAAGRPSAADPLQAVRMGIRNLVEGTRARLIDALSRIDDPLHGGRLVHFGAQIAALDTTIDTILRPLMPNPGRGRTGVFLRGLYLTSARQDALTIDALLPDLATRFAMPRSGTMPPDLDDGERSEGFFIASTMRRAILGEAGLVGRVRPPWYRRPMVVGTCALGLVAATLVSAVALQASHLRAHAEIDAVRRAGDRFDPAVLLSDRADPETLTAIAVQTDRLARFDIANPDAVPWWPFLGGDGVQEAARAAYRQALVNSLRPHLVARLETDLLDLDAPSETLAQRLAAADPAAPNHRTALAAWIDTLAEDAGETSAANALRVQAPLAMADLPPASGPDPVFLDTARRIIAYQEGTR